MANVTVEYSTGGGVVFKGNHFLLLARPKKAEIRLPKGHIDQGETSAATALRETMEETGYADLEIVADLGFALVEFEHEGKSFRRTEFYFLMELKSDRRVQQPKQDKAQFDPFWCSVAEGLQLLTYKEEQEVLKRGLDAWKKLK